MHIKITLRTFDHEGLFTYIPLFIYKTDTDMTTRFNNAINALVQAFFTDTLAKGSCAACAVGNIVAFGFGEKLNPDELLTPVSSKEGFANDRWSLAFMTGNGIQEFYSGNFSDARVIACISATGYSVLELAKIEFAFEKNTTITCTKYYDHTKEAIMQDQYNGLMAVVDVLCELEGIEDPAEYKELFAYQ